jgi:protein TonB
MRKLFGGILLMLLSMSTYAQTQTDNDIVTEPEIEAEFPGGVPGMFKYISENIKYPESAIKNKEEGKVYVSFIVESTGEVTDVKIIRGVSEQLDAEAIRVIESMPKWEPAKLNNIAVRTENKLPIAFKF